MATKTRYQNPVVGDTICLKLYSRNSNNFADLHAIDHIDIYQEVCPTKCDNASDVTVEADVLVETIAGTDVEKCCTGIYHIDLVTSAPTYQIGKYHDVWHVIFNPGDPVTQWKQDFKINPDLWVLSDSPVVYSFDFRFTPNRIRQGSKKHLVIQTIPNIPRATDLKKYYENIAISADLRINIEQNCGQCLPSEADLRLVVDNQPVTERDKVFSYYFIDTSDWDCGIYNVWFEMDFAGSTEISPKQQIQVY